eukprot:3259177-Rhodomonas_salina.1
MCAHVRSFGSARAASSAPMMAGVVGRWMGSAPSLGSDTQPASCAISSRTSSSALGSASAVRRKEDGEERARCASQQARKSGERSWRWLFHAKERASRSAQSTQRSQAKDSAVSPHELARSWWLARKLPLSITACSISASPRCAAACSTVPPPLRK